MNNFNKCLILDKCPPLQICNKFNNSVKLNKGHTLCKLVLTSTNLIFEENSNRYYPAGIGYFDIYDAYQDYIEITSDDLIIEPSAGNGSFISGIKSLSNKSLTEQELALTRDT